MKPDIEKIIAEIRTEPDGLDIDISTLRAVVTALVENQPTVTIDQAFKTRLRAELLGSWSAVVAEKPRVSPWWFVYMVPVGVTAVLLLLVQPSVVQSPHIPGETLMEESAPAMMQMDEGARAKSAGDATFRSEPATAEDAYSIQDSSQANDFFTAAFTADRTMVRVAYLSLGTPGFIQVTGPEGVVLMSELLPAGEQTDLLLPVLTSVTKGVAYTAELYYDNGDGRYVAGEETAASLSVILVP